MRKGFMIWSLFISLTLSAQELITVVISRDEWRCGHAEGAVDFYCIVGRAGAENCEFISHNGPAAIWHDGSAKADSKTVLLNGRFSGYDGFQLGRYHRDAQFFRLNCSFASNMKDQPIYLVPTSNTLQWGKRIYYYNCHREGGKDFDWHSNNLPAGMAATDINLDWAFNQQWNPSKNDL